jgi:hypothetical protein
MDSLSRRLFLSLGSITLTALPKPKAEQVYFFATEKYEIRMALEFHDHCTSGGFRFQERLSHRHFCLSSQGEENRDCLGNFTGAITVARYKILSHVRSEPAVSVREYVRSIDQGDRVPARPPFERTIKLQDGLVSDIQAFGYQEQALSRNGIRKPDPGDAWCLLRQDLYFNGAITPFLVVHWKHTLIAIRALDIYSSERNLAS